MFINSTFPHRIFQLIIKNWVLCTIGCLLIIGLVVKSSLTNGETDATSTVQQKIEYYLEGTKLSNACYVDIANWGNSCNQLVKHFIHHNEYQLNVLELHQLSTDQYNVLRNALKQYKIALDKVIKAAPIKIRYTYSQE